MSSLFVSKARLDAMHRQLRHAEEEAAQLRGERQRTLAARGGGGATGVSMTNLPG